jgi:hypothetical protein
MRQGLFYLPPQDQASCAVLWRRWWRGVGRRVIRRLDRSMVLCQDISVGQYSPAHHVLRATGTVAAACWPDTEATDSRLQQS